MNCIINWKIIWWGSNTDITHLWIELICLKVWKLQRSNAEFAVNNLSKLVQKCKIKIKTKQNGQRCEVRFFVGQVFTPLKKTAFSLSQQVSTATSFLARGGNLCPPFPFILECLSGFNLCRSYREI